MESADPDTLKLGLTLLGFSVSYLLTSIIYTIKAQDKIDAEAAKRRVWENLTRKY